MYIRRWLLLFRQIYILTNQFANNTSTVNLLVVKMLCTQAVVSYNIAYTIFDEKHNYLKLQEVHILLRVEE